MKKIVLGYAVVLLSVGLLSGCNKDNKPNENTNPVNPDEVEPGAENPNSDGDDDGDGETGDTEHSWLWEHDSEGHWQVCSVCGETTTKEDHNLTYTEEDSEYHITTCDICGYETTDEHTWVITSTDPATCTTSGTTYYECELCGATKETTIDALGHDYDTSTWGGYDETYHYHVCKNCGAYDEGTKEVHTLEYISDGEGGHHQVCSECQYTTTTTGHNLGSYISDEVNGHYKECSDCDYTTSDENHDLSYVSDDDTYHHQECSECDYRTENEEHIYEETNVSIENLGADSNAITATIEYTCCVCEHTKIETNQPYTLNFTTDSWDIINQVSTEGYASTYYNIDDRKTISVLDEEYEIRIIDFDHDELTTTDDNYDASYNDGEHAGITCDMVDCLSTNHGYYGYYAMNNSQTNVGGWAECEMRTSTLPTFFDTLDSDLQSAIKMVDKKSTIGGGSTSSHVTEISTSSNKLFLLAYAEVFNTDHDGYRDEGTQYAYWSTCTTDASRIKYFSGSTASDGWWIRSPFTEGSHYFRCFNKKGTVENATAGPTPMVPVSFAFCI